MNRSFAPVRGTRRHAPRPGRASGANKERGVPGTPEPGHRATHDAQREETAPAAPAGDSRYCRPVHHSEYAGMAPLTPERAPSPLSPLPSSAGHPVHHRKSAHQWVRTMPREHARSTPKASVPRPDDAGGRVRRPIPPATRRHPQEEAHGLTSRSSRPRGRLHFAHARRHLLEYHHQDGRVTEHRVIARAAIAALATFLLIYCGLRFL